MWQCALSSTIASIESKVCRDLSVSCSALLGHIVIKVCRFGDFGTIPLPRKPIAFPSEITLVLPVLLVLAANLSWQNGKALLAKNTSLPEHVCSRSSEAGEREAGRTPCLKRRCVLWRFPLPFWRKSGYNSL